MKLIDSAFAGPVIEEEEAAEPIAALVSGEAAPPAEGARAQIPEPELPPEVLEAPPAFELPAPVEVPSAEEWRNVAAGKVKARGRRKGGRVEVPVPEGAATVPSPAPDAKPAMTPEMAAQIKAQKASGYVQLAEFGLLFLARRWSVAEKEIAFSPDEKKALAEAVEPLVSAEVSDPWGNLFAVALVTVGPRVQTLHAAAKSQKAAEGLPSSGVAA